MERAITAAHVADFLEKGFLDVLTDLFRSDPALYSLFGEILQDKRFVVRLGAVALVETLAEADPDRMDRAAAALLPLLGSENPTHRGDVAYLLGIVGRRETLSALKMAAESDPNSEVRELAREAIELVQDQGSGGSSE